MWCHDSSDIYLPPLVILSCSRRWYFFCFLVLEAHWLKWPSPLKRQPQSWFLSSQLFGGFNVLFLVILQKLFYLPQTFVHYINFFANISDCWPYFLMTFITHPTEQERVPHSITESIPEHNTRHEGGHTAGTTWPMCIDLEMWML